MLDKIYFSYFFFLIVFIVIKLYGMYLYEIENINLKCNNQDFNLSITSITLDEITIFSINIWEKFINQDTVKLFYLIFIVVYFIIIILVFMLKFHFDNKNDIIKKLTKKVNYFTFFSFLNNIFSFGVKLNYNLNSFILNTIFLFSINFFVFINNFLTVKKGNCFQINTSLQNIIFSNTIICLISMILVFYIFIVLIISSLIALTNFDKYSIIDYIYCSISKQNKYIADYLFSKHIFKKIIEVKKDLEYSKTRYFDIKYHYKKNLLDINYCNYNYIDYEYKNINFKSIKMDINRFKSELLLKLDTIIINENIRLKIPSEKTLSQKIMYFLQIFFFIIFYIIIIIMAIEVNYSVFLQFNINNNIFDITNIIIINYAILFLVSIFLDWSSISIFFKNKNNNIKTIPSNNNFKNNLDLKISIGSKDNSNRPNLKQKYDKNFKIKNEFIKNII